ncbi:dihydrofolate reductase family protein [Microlunatus parietis]|uniref:dihydrofolate reductase family protein n=1 Tax=Microlunatus parietis TaxID=682979 RepID=UPI001FECE4F1|nr:dihydrofolate reductase family protein [Microlunatus parietis]
MRRPAPSSQSGAATTQEGSQAAARSGSESKSGSIAVTVPHRSRDRDPGPPGFRRGPIEASPFVGGVSGGPAGAAHSERGDQDDCDVHLRRAGDAGRLRSHGSLSLNRALLAAGLVDRVQLTIFPVISGRTGTDPIFRGAADFDLELIESRTLDGHTQELSYRPIRHG